MDHYISGDRENLRLLGEAELIGFFGDLQNNHLIARYVGYTDKNTNNMENALIGVDLKFSSDSAAVMRIVKLVTNPTLAIM